MQTDDKRSDEILFALGETELEPTLTGEQTVPEGHTTEDAAAAAAVHAHHEVGRLKAEYEAAVRRRQDAIEQLRDVHGWSHQLVAELLGVTRSTAQGIAERRTASGTVRARRRGADG
ncbi:MAG: hypothetical protein JWM93_3993 [Frankiales bacterium]|nr:hypothetical protein [Frankiales bacterium]